MKGFWIQFYLLSLLIASSFLEGTPSDFLFLKARQLPALASETTEGRCKFPIGEIDESSTDKDYKEGSFSDIAGPFYDLTFQSLFGKEETKDCLCGFLNAIYYPENYPENPYITQVEFIGENKIVTGGERADKHGSSQIRFDVACRCYFRDGEQEKTFDIEMQNSVRKDHSKRFFNYGIILKGLNQEVPAVVLVLLNHKEDKKQWLVDAARKSKDAGEWLAVCSLNLRKNEKDEVQVDENGEPEVVLKKVIDDVLEMEEIDLRSQVGKILNNKDVFVGKHKLLSAGLEWIKLLGLWHWAKEDENGRFRVPSEECISDPHVRKAVRILKGIPQAAYEITRAKFKKEWDDLAYERKEGRKEGREEGREEGRIEGELKSLMRSFIRNREIEDDEIEEIIGDPVGENFIKRIWDTFSNIPSDKTVDDFIARLGDKVRPSEKN